LHNSVIALRAESTITMPVANVVRLPAVTRLKPSEWVSAMTARTLSTGMPSSSAAIMLMEMREPATSEVPRISVIEPSVATFRVPVVSPPRLNQKPAATPRPWPSGTGEL
jgi:hypothetical protein